MDYRRLGRSGLEVSVVGVGCNQFGGPCDRKQTRAIVHAAMDVGITLFDTSNSYGEAGRSEKFLGAALKGCRDDAVVATKFASAMGDGPMQRGGSRRHVMQAVEDSLRRLRTDYIDLYQMHRPDPNTPSRRRFPRSISSSARARCATSGIRTSPDGRSPPPLPPPSAPTSPRSYQRKTNTASSTEAWNLKSSRPARPLACRCFPYFPLASGLLSGKYRPGVTPPAGARLAEGSQADRWRTPSNVARTERLRAVADAHGRTLLELAMSWLARQPVIASVIAGASRPGHVRQNVASVGWAMGPDELEAIEAALSDSDGT